MANHKKPETGGVTLRPLTACDALGRPYERPPAIQDEIETVLGLESGALVDSADNLRDETLVYLIRERRRAQDWAIAERLVRVLIERCRRVLLGTLHSLPQDVRDEAIRTVLQQLFARITDLDDDRGDFYQIRFALGIKRLGTSAFRQCVLTLARDRLTEQQNAEPSDSRDASFNPHQWPDDAVDLRDARKGLEAIKDNRHREAFFLHKVRDMPIESDDPELATISRHFGVSPRTVNNWLKQAEADLARWRKGIS